MPFCPQCGAENLPASRFCDQCGAELIPVPTKPAGAAPKPAAPIAAPAPVAGVAAGSATCHQCGMAVIPGEAFCENCGAPLSAPSINRNVPPQPIYPPPQQVGGDPVAQLPPVIPALVKPPVAAPPVPPPPPVQAPPKPVGRTMLVPARLLLVNRNAELPLPAAAQALIGRADAASSFFPEIDLTAHGGLESGVGRRHLRLSVQDGQIVAEDLDSTNGTFINGVKLAPRMPKPLQNGDELRLGSLPLKIIF